MAQRSVDLLITDAGVLTFDDANTVVRDGAIAIAGRRLPDLVAGNFDFRLQPEGHDLGVLGFGGMAKRQAMQRIEVAPEWPLAGVIERIRTIDGELIALLRIAHLHLVAQPQRVGGEAVGLRIGARLPREPGEQRVERYQRRLAWPWVPRRGSRP